MDKFTDPATVRAIVRYHGAISGTVPYLRNNSCITLFMAYSDGWLTRSISNEEFHELLDDVEFIRMLVEEELDG